MRNRSIVFILACVLVCLTALGGSARSLGASAPKNLAMEQSPSGAGLNVPHFAIGDFDGDEKPDLATVEVDPYDQHIVRYSIQLQLSLGPKSAIHLTAPIGGLLLSAKDVNGDLTLDLVVTTALDSQLVAVLVNDGHGNFSLAAEGAFPELEIPWGCHISAPADLSSDRASVLQSRCPIEDGEETVSRFHAPRSSEALVMAERQDLRRWNVSASLGRSPPLCFFQP
jgi:hypothetical protein